MSKNGYWFFSVRQKRPHPYETVLNFIECVSSVHPFVGVADLERSMGSELTLLSFQRISKGEYDLFLSLERNQSIPWAQAAP